MSHSGDGGWVSLNVREVSNFGRDDWARRRDAHTTAPPAALVAWTRLDPFIRRSIVLVAVVRTTSYSLQLVPELRNVNQNATMTSANNKVRAASAHLTILSPARHLLALLIVNSLVVVTCTYVVRTASQAHRLNIDLLRKRGRGSSDKIRSGAS